MGNVCGPAIFLLSFKNYNFQNDCALNYFVLAEMDNALPWGRARTWLIKTLFIMTSQKSTVEAVSLYDLSQIHHSFLSCSPLLCQCVVSLGSMFSIWENSLRTKLTVFSAFSANDVIIKGSIPLARAAPFGRHCHAQTLFNAVYSILFSGISFLYCFVLLFDQVL